MRANFRFGDGVVIATFTKKDFTTNHEFSALSSMMCASQGFSGEMELEGTSEEVRDKLQSRVKYALLAHNFRRICNDDDAVDLHFGKEKDLLKYIEKFR